MNPRHRILFITMIVVIVLLASPLLVYAQAGKKAPVTVPQGTQITLKYGDDDTVAALKPAEQVAFLFVYGIWGLQGDCYDKDNGIGRLCTLPELVKGVTKDGRTIGLKVDPAADANYTYDVTIVGGDCMIRAIPRTPGLGSFGMAGTPRRFSGNLYYNPKGADLSQAQKATEYGYNGDGFKR